MSTNASSLTAYATPADLLIHHDANQVGDLVSDSKVRVPPAALLTHATVQQALKWASGQVEAACLVAQRYTSADLTALVGMAQQALVGLVCDLAFFKLRERRFSEAEIPTSARLAFDMLERLRLGERIFGLVEIEEAGLPEATNVTQTILQNRMYSTTLARRFYGRRSSELRAYRANW